MKRRELLKQAGRFAGAVVALPIVGKFLPVQPAAAAPVISEIAAPAFDAALADVWVRQYQLQRFTLGMKITRESLEADLYDAFTYRGVAR